MRFFLVGYLSLLFVVTQSVNAESKLDYNYFKNEVQPILLAKRPGRLACYSCHQGKKITSGFHLEYLSEGATFWNEEQSRHNFETVSMWVVPGQDPMLSRFLKHPLAKEAGGDAFHGGGKQFNSQEDPEWKIMRDWVAGASARAPIKNLTLRIIQTNSAGDDVHIIDPVEQKVVNHIKDIDKPHGVQVSPDGARLYITNEGHHSVDVIDTRTMRLYRRISLSNKPHNLALSQDGSKLYVGIFPNPGAVIVVDTEKLEAVKEIQTEGGIHNVYVTPDGKYAVAGSVQESTINVIDTATDEMAWVLKMSSGIRPMTFDTNPDGSTRNIYVQLSNYHGFAVVDFEKRKEVRRIEHPVLAGVEPHYDGLQLAPAHGLGISPDGKYLWSLSKVYGYAYIHTLSDLKEVARIPVGQHPEWLAFTTDGSQAYIGAAGDNATVVIDTDKLIEVNRIPVGQAPKRLISAMLPAE